MADIVRRDPFVGSLRQAMENFFDDGFFRDPLATFPRFISDEGSLPLDVYEKDGKLMVEASLPGFAKNEIDVQVHDGVLSIKAQHSEDKEESKDNGKYYRRERSWNAVSRRVALPGVVDDANVEATLKDGVLTLSVPQAEKAKPKQIEIKG